MNRKPRHLLKQEWSTLRAEIEQACQKHSIQSNDFRALRLTEWQAIDRAIAQQFFALDTCQGNEQLWNRLSPASYSIGIKDCFFNNLNWFLPVDESAYFFVGETMNEQTKYWFYEGNISTISTIIAEASNMKEYFLVAKKYNWLFCYNFYAVVGYGSIINTMIANKEKFIR